jgi:protein gp37
MAENSAISWTDHTHNPVMGCMKVSPGCKNCYAEKLITNRMGKPNLWGPNSDRQITSAANWRKPLTWNKQAVAEGRRYRVFCASLADVFEDHPVWNETARPRLFELIKQTPMLDWQLLTKRPENIQGFLPEDWGRGYPNVWLGTSIESAKYALRAALLRAIPAVVRFISYEPALGPLAGMVNLTGIDWVIYGGESGPGFRPDDLQWARDIRDACADSGTAFFYKQTAAFKPGQGATLDGVVHHNWPAPVS